MNILHVILFSTSLRMTEVSEHPRYTAVDTSCTGGVFAKNIWNIIQYEREWICLWKRHSRHLWSGSFSGFKFHRTFDRNRICWLESLIKRKMANLFGGWVWILYQIQHHEELVLRATYCLNQENLIHIVYFVFS